MSKDSGHVETKDPEEQELEKLKAASLEIYRSGISIKLAARKHDVQLSKLRYYYENEAHEILPIHGDSDGSDDMWKGIMRAGTCGLYVLTRLSSDGRDMFSLMVMFGYIGRKQGSSTYYAF